VARVKTFTNGGSLLPGDLNSMEDDYEFAFSTYKDLLERGGASAAAPAAATLVLPDSGGTTLAAVPVNLDDFAFYFDPADRTANTRVNKLRVRAQVFTNAVAPATNWTVGLYPIATYGGASGAAATAATLGTVVAGSTVAVNAPGATSQNQGNSGDFTSPAAGYYVFAVVNSGAAAAGSLVTVRAVLQARQV
jgi:hypothetical protein